MAAIKGSERPDMTGNQFWKLRAKHGRDAIFQDPEKLWECALDYFRWCDDHPYHKAEQKKGNTIIPKNTELTTENIKDLSNQVTEIPIVRPYTLTALTLYLGVHSQYFRDFEANLDNMQDRQKAKDFSLIITRIKDLVASQQIDGGMIGAYNPMLTARILGLKEKTDITSNDKDIQGIGNIVITREDYKSITKDIDKEV